MTVLFPLPVGPTIPVAWPRSTGERQMVNGRRICTRKAHIAKLNLPRSLDEWLSLIGPLSWQTENLIEGFKGVGRLPSFKASREDRREGGIQLLNIEGECEQGSDGDVMREKLPSSPSKGNAESYPIDQARQGKANKLVLCRGPTNDAAILIQPVSPSVDLPWLVAGGTHFPNTGKNFLKHFMALFHHGSQARHLFMALVGHPLCQEPAERKKKNGCQANLPTESKNKPD